MSKPEADLKKAKVRSRILNAVRQIESSDILLDIAGYLRERGFKCDTRDLLEPLRDPYEVQREMNPAGRDGLD